MFRENVASTRQLQLMRLLEVFIAFFDIDFGSQNVGSSLLLLLL